MGILSGRIRASGRKRGIGMHQILPGTRILPNLAQAVMIE